MEPSIPQSQQILARAVAAHQGGNITQAEFLYKLVLQADKKQFDALHMLGVIEGQRGNFAAGLERLQQALRIRPKSSDALINMGRMQSELGLNAEAAASYQKALALDPKSALAHSNLSIVLRELGENDEALAHCDTALKLAPNYAEAWNNRGSVLVQLERFEEALEDYERAIALQPKLAEAHLGRGNVLSHLKRYDAALSAYDRSLGIKPDQAGCWYGRGNILHQMQRFDEALAAYDRGLAIKSDYAECHVARGEMLVELRQFQDAYDAFETAIALKPKMPYLEGSRLGAKLQICKWDNLDAERSHLIAEVRDRLPRIDPFRFFAISGSPADQLICAEVNAADRFPPAPQSLFLGARSRHDRIRVAYLSADFRDHPVAFLVAGMFEAHDRSRFDTTAVSYGSNTKDQTRARLEQAFDRFLDVREQSDDEIARALRELEIDIAVELTGMTVSSRLGVLARRVAPIQASYIGYTGPTGANYIDYVLADRVVIPPEEDFYYTEKVVRLPDSYMVNDDRRQISERTPSREECGLPKKGFVFCCFNNTLKFNPETFRVWMRLLAAVPSSVLWLSEANLDAEVNLRREAERDGVSGDRLIFAPRLASIADHLARQRQADLFIDTLPFNAHVTASDALWAAVPVLTCSGATFAGRVGASLLHAIGLPELVTASISEYEAMALKIAHDAAFHAALREKLTHNRENFPLFDTKRSTRNIEAAYTAMWDRFQRGKEPGSFTVNPAE
jgi:protein O-GlcNAc transferase